MGRMNDCIYKRIHQQKHLHDDQDTNACGACDSALTATNPRRRLVFENGIALVLRNLPIGSNFTVFLEPEIMLHADGSPDRNPVAKVIKLDRCL